MSAESLHEARVAQAHAEIGRTAVSHVVAMTLAACFVAAIVAVPVTQAWIGPGVLRFVPDAAGVPRTDVEAPSLLTRVLRHNRNLLATLDRFTDRLDTDSLLAQHLRPAVQLLLTRGARTGNERVYTGQNGWLYYAPDLRHVLGRGFLEAGQLARRAASGDSLSAAPAPDPRPALIQFNQALARRGITLVLLPTPVKPTIHPEHLGLARSIAPVRNVSFATFVEEIRAAGVLLFDPAPMLADLGARGDPAYLATDTHWRPESVIEVAQHLARFLERATPLPALQPVSPDTRPARASNWGDTVGLLNLRDHRSPYATETVALRQVLTPDGEPWRPDRSADVLLLGDSFSNIYSQAAMGWGEGAGLGEQLSAALRRPVDRLVQNDNGAFATREALARALARDQDRLTGTRVVVYQFATRELSHGDWRLVDVDRPPPRAASTVLSPATGQTLTVRGRVRQRAPVPRPGTVPYRDHIVAIDLGNIVTADTPVDGTEALVYLSSMEDNVWTDAATIAVGQTITLTLRPWAEVAPGRDGITRAELVDGNVAFAEPWWGEFADQ